MSLIGKKSKNKYSFGDKVTVKVVRADKDRSEVDFEIYDAKENLNNNKNNKSNNK